MIWLFFFFWFKVKLSRYVIYMVNLSILCIKQKQQRKEVLIRDSLLSLIYRFVHKSNKLH